MGEASGDSVERDAELVFMAGSVDSGAMSIAVELDARSGDAYSRSLLAASWIIRNSPVELQGSFGLCCLYHKFQKITRDSIKSGNMQASLQAQKEISNLFKLVQ